MPDIQFIPKPELDRISNAKLDKYTRLALLADMCRLNALASVKRAGSGHLGSSFSSLDIVSYLYFNEMNIPRLSTNDPDRDIYFSSKGHDVPGLYAVLYAMGILPQDQFLNLRRIDGTPGHPAVGTPGIEANSGSLGMGISKGRGMAWAKRFQKRGGRVFVMTGDGEWQEGQNFEALQSAVQQRVSNLTILVDHNKVQSDKLVSEILDLGDLEKKFAAFGWHVARCDGHDFRALERVIEEFKRIEDKPKILIADTIKGRGVPFMEHPVALKAGNGFYRWHAGAPDDESYLRAHAHLVGSIQSRLTELNLLPLALEVAPPVTPGSRLLSDLAHQDSLGEPVSHPARRSRNQAPDAAAQNNMLGEPLSQAAASAVVSRVSSEYVVEAYGQALVDLAEAHPNLVVLDGDLSSDCRLRSFEEKFPDRFIENGIAEQDMVSMAGGLARQGLLPVVNSFASFLAARANEQIYNNACESGHIIYVMHYAGLIPAGPGSSHQSVRDISLMGALPGVVILQPCNATETRAALKYCVESASLTCVLRVNIGPSPRALELPGGYSLKEGHGVVLHQGQDAVLFAYGPVLLHEALVAAEKLESVGFGLRVVNLPWLNRVDTAWLNEIVESTQTVFVLEDHASFGGLNETLGTALNGLQGHAAPSLRVFAVNGLPIWGTPAETLHHHELDGASIAARILRHSDQSYFPSTRY